MKLAPDNFRSWQLRRRQLPARLFGAALAGAALASPLAVMAAERPLLTISTNNTPLDRKALQALSEEAGRRAGIDLKFVSLPSERSLVAAAMVAYGLATALAVGLTRWQPRPA